MCLNFDYRYHLLSIFAACAHGKGDTILNNDKSLAWQAGHTLCAALLVIQIIQLFVVPAMAYWLRLYSAVSALSLFVLVLAFVVLFIMTLLTGYRLAMDFNQAACGLWDIRTLGKLFISQLITILLALLLQSLALLLT